MRKIKTKLALLLAILLLLLPLTAYAAMVGTSTGSGGSSGGGGGGSYSDSGSASSAMHDDYSSGADMSGSYYSYPGGGCSWGDPFGDSGSGGGGGGGSTPSCYDYSVDVSAPDFEVSQIGPSVMRKDYRALAYVNVKNIGNLQAKANVAVKINGEVVNMTTIDLPANGNHTLSFGYYTPRATGELTFEVEVNPQHPTNPAPRTTTRNSCYGGGYELEYGSKGDLSPAEYDYTNNTFSGKIAVSKYPDIPTTPGNFPEPTRPNAFLDDIPDPVIDPVIDWPNPPVTPVTPSDPSGPVTPGTPTTPTTPVSPGGSPISPVPVGNNDPETEWIDSDPTGADVTYHAKEEMTVEVHDKGRAITALKSGYGFELKVTVKVTTDYPTEEKVHAPKKVILYIPDGGDYKDAVELVRTDSGGEYVPAATGSLTTTWKLPANAKSGTNAEKWYIPEWWPDSEDYKFVVECKGAYTPGGEATSAKVCTIAVDSNMYTDDYTPGG